MMKTQKKLNSGFTLVEMMVAVSVFVTVMVIFSASILAVFDANLKSKNLRSVMDNLNLSMESMTRTIRFGTNYHCGNSGNLSQPNDCSSGSSSLTVLSPTGAQTTFALSSGRITRTIGGVTSNITSSDVTISTLSFRVYGSPAFPDLFQPQVIIVVKGSVGSNSKANDKGNFSLETTVSQRSFDLQ